MRVENADYQEALVVGASIRTQQDSTVNLVDARRGSHVGARHHVDHHAVRGSQQEPAPFVGQRTNTRGQHRLALRTAQSKHLHHPIHLARPRKLFTTLGTVARAKQMQERRAKAKADSANGDRVVATNRRARHDYEILETLECGIILSGSEVKSLREGKAQITESYARLDDGELWLYGAHIPPWVYAVGFGSHDPDRRRKLLAHRHQIDKLLATTRTQPLTIVPLKLYFKDGRAKIEIALARGRKQHDRRQAIAKRDAEREIARTVRNIEKFG